MIRAAAFVLLSLIGPDPISVGEYRDRLGSIRSAIDAGDLETARRRAADLQSIRVRHDGSDFAPDPTVLRPVAEAKDLPSARDAARAVSRVQEALESIPSARASAPDAERLERLRREEAERSVDPGDRIGGPELHAPRVPRSLREWLEDLSMRLYEALKDALRKLFGWLLRMLFGSAGLKGGPGQSMSTLVLGLMIIILAVLGLAAFLALQRRKAIGDLPATVVPAASGRDEDPLSRTSSEWERFAAELMRSGRFREAIRAWYHAVLVTLFRAGLLHYRKDRTNWEYAYALGPDLPWRSGFVEATRTFEVTWYGRRETAQDAAETYAAEARGLLDKVRGGREP
jgi:hypothetical protein